MTVQALISSIVEETDRYQVTATSTALSGAPECVYSGQFPQRMGGKDICFDIFMGSREWAMNSERFRAVFIRDENAVYRAMREPDLCDDVGSVLSRHPHNDENPFMQVLAQARAPHVVTTTVVHFDNYAYPVDEVNINQHGPAQAPVVDIRVRADNRTIPLNPDEMANTVARLVTTTRSVTDQHTDEQTQTIHFLITSFEIQFEPIRMARYLHVQGRQVEENARAPVRQTPAGRYEIIGMDFSEIESRVMAHLTEPRNEIDTVTMNMPDGRTVTGRLTTPMPAFPSRPPQHINTRTATTASQAEHERQTQERTIQQIAQAFGMSAERAADNLRQALEPLRQVSVRIDSINPSILSQLMGNDSSTSVLGGDDADQIEAEEQQNDDRPDFANFASLEQQIREELEMFEDCVLTTTLIDEMDNALRDNLGLRLISTNEQLLRGEIVVDYLPDIDPLLTDPQYDDDLSDELYIRKVSSPRIVLPTATPGRRRINIGDE